MNKRRPNTYDYESNNEKLGDKKCYVIKENEIGDNNGADYSGDDRGRAGKQTPFSVDHFSVSTILLTSIADIVI